MERSEKSVAEQVPLDRLTALFVAERKLLELGLATLGREPDKKAASDSPEEIKRVLSLARSRFDEVQAMSRKMALRGPRFKR